MKKVGDMKLYSFEELLEEDYGKVGTPEREQIQSHCHHLSQGRICKRAPNAQPARFVIIKELPDELNLKDETEIRRVVTWLSFLTRTHAGNLN